MERKSPCYLMVPMAEPLSDELAAAMADFLFELAQNFENTFYTRIETINGYLYKGLVRAGYFRSSPRNVRMSRSRLVMPIR